MRFELFIASRYLRAKRRQAFIGIITGISIAGVAAGVASLVVALAINNGFRQDLQQRLLGSTSHISLQRIADDGIKDWPPLMDRLSKQPHVVGAAPAIFEQVLIAEAFKTAFLFPICLSAQFKAFLTKLRSSEASLTIRGRKSRNVLFEASLL